MSLTNLTIENAKATGKLIDGIAVAEAEAIARGSWLGSADVGASVEAVQLVSTEYGGALPAWRVTFADAEATRVFVDARIETITAVRTGTWRLYDFFWGLHIRITRISIRPGSSPSRSAACCSGLVAPFSCNFRWPLG